MSNGMKKVAIIGVGNCGSQVANLAEKKYPTLFDCIYINTSEADLSMVESVNDNLKFKIGEKDEVEGSGKNRTKMKEYLERDIEKLMSNEDLHKTILDKKYVYIVTSAAGGTGSGATPILFEIMRQFFPDTNFVLVAVVQQLNASLMEQGNSLEFLNEMYDGLGESTTYMIYDNQTTAHLPSTIGLTTVNEAIVEDIRVFTGVDNYATPYESIDDADMESLAITPGRTIVVRINKDLTAKYVEDHQIDDMIVKAIKNSCHVEVDRNKKVIRWGVITYLTEDVNELYSSDLEGLRKFIGTPIERFNHNAVNKGRDDQNFIYVILSGLSPINDRVTKITDKIQELKESLANDDTSKYILSGDGASYDVLEERKKQHKRATQPEEIQVKDIFNKFKK